MCVWEGYDVEPPVHHVLESLKELSGAVERLMAFPERRHVIA